MAEHIPDGGPAFPLTGGSWEACGGMSLRDWFAGQALAGGFADYLTSGDAWDGYNDFAESCYRMADAMLKAREKRN